MPVRKFKGIHRELKEPFERETTVRVGGTIVAVRGDRYGN